MCEKSDDLLVCLLAPYSFCPYALTRTWNAIHGERRGSFFFFFLHQHAPPKKATRSPRCIYHAWSLQNQKHSIKANQFKKTNQKNPLPKIAVSVVMHFLAVDHFHQVAITHHNNTHTTSLNTAAGLYRTEPGFTELLLLLFTGLPKYARLRFSVCTNGIVNETTL